MCNISRHYYIICEVSEVEVTEIQFNNYLEHLKDHQDHLRQRVFSEIDNDHPDLVYWFYSTDSIQCFVAYSCLE